MRQATAASGSFVETKDGTAAVIPVHIADQRQHRPPNGWSLATSFIDGDYEVFVYVPVERTA